MPRLTSTVTGVTVSCSKETAALLGSEWAAAETDDKTEPEGYAALKVDELNAQIDDRNKDRDDDARIVPAGTKKADLVAALEADDNKAE